jgi:hypothetical protein
MIGTLEAKRLRVQIFVRGEIMDAMVAISSSVPRFEALVLLFHFGVSHLTSNVIAAPYFCSPKIAIVGAEEYVNVFSSQLKPSKTPNHFFFKILFT